MRVALLLPAAAAAAARPNMNGAYEISATPGGSADAFPKKYAEYRRPSGN